MMGFGLNDEAFIILYSILFGSARVYIAVINKFKSSPESALRLTGCGLPFFFSKEKNEPKQIG